VKAMSEKLKDFSEDVIEEGDDYIQTGNINYSDGGIVSRVYVVQDKYAGSKDNLSYTISPHSSRIGWETDSGCDGYGLPKDLAEQYAKAINEYIDKNGSIEVKSKY